MMSRKTSFKTMVATFVALSVLFLWSSQAVSVVLKSRPDCVAWGLDKPNQLHCFVIGDDGHLWEKAWRDGTWHTWQDLGASPRQKVEGQPSCVAWGPNKPDQLHCFVRGSSDSTLQHKGWWDGAWHDWQDLGKPAGGIVDWDPRCLAWGLDKPNQLHCFVTGDDGHLWQKGWRDGGWQTWQDLGAPTGQKIESQPSCVAWGLRGLSKPDELHCFVAGVHESHLWHKGWWEGTWHNWQDLGRPSAHPVGGYPSCVAWGLEKLDQLHCFAGPAKGISYDSHLVHVGWWNGTWHNWEDLGSPYKPSSQNEMLGLDCMAWGMDKPNQLHCFATYTTGSPSHAFFHIGWWDGAWHGWENLGSGEGSKGPDCLAWGPDKPNQLHCFVTDDDGELRHRGWWDRAWHDWEDLEKP